MGSRLVQFNGLLGLSVVRGSVRQIPLTEFLDTPLVLRCFPMAWVLNFDCHYVKWSLIS